MQEIDLEQLNNLCKDFLGRLNQQWQERNDIFQLAYNTGIRISEALLPERWTYKRGEYIYLETLKWNKTREINIELIPENLLNKYINNTNDFYFTYDMLRHDMRKEFPKLIFNGNKNHSVCHAFRYNYIKRLAQEGMSADDLMIHIGHKKVTTTEYYINAPIFMEVPEDKRER